MKPLGRFVVTLLATGLMAGPAVAQDAAEPGTGAMLRGLDRIDATTTDLELRNGATAPFGDLEITLKECRYPMGNPSGDAYAYLSIRQDGRDLFDGWMIASSPALNALDHFRYDIWVLRCTLPGNVQDPAQAPVAPPEPVAPQDGEEAPVD
ncbi:DUF2155 domain-containing protein [Pseudooceanicola algae]|uniref:DUF2155 domain-containing protein n=1 Tax=Pseudooceanicola algae TaxID=1537215 RepID=A0A418SKB7_9RHOB|nr:hypothetical protein PSAL_002970 [Pseudooceanicola algae]